MLCLSHAGNIKQGNFFTERLEKEYPLGYATCLKTVWKFIEGLRTGKEKGKWI